MTDPGGLDQHSAPPRPDGRGSHRATALLDARSVTRAGVVALLASGQETFHLVRVVDAVVGHPMILDVLVGGVRLPMTTSAVASIAVTQRTAAARKETA